MKLRANRGKAIVQRIIKHKSDGGVLLPESRKGEIKQTGIVMSVGPGTMYNCGEETPVFKTGDKVTYNIWHKDEDKLEIGGDTLDIISHDDVEAIIED